MFVWPLQVQIQTAIARLSGLDGNCMCRVASKLQSKFFCGQQKLFRCSVFHCLPTTFCVYEIMHIVGFGKGLSLGFSLVLHSPSCENCFSLAIRTTGLTSACLYVNTLAMITIVYRINWKKTTKKKKKQPTKTKPRSLKQPNSVGYKLSTNWTVINTLSTVPTKLMSTQESCIPWFC